MTVQRHPSRRALALGAVAIGAVRANLGHSEASAADVSRKDAKGAPASAAQLGLKPNLTTDQSVTLQSALDHSAARGGTLMLEPGRYVVGDIVLRPGTRLRGAGPGTVLVYSGAGAMVRGAGAHGAGLFDLSIDGGLLPLAAGRARALIQIEDARQFVIEGITVMRSRRDGVALLRSSGRVHHSLINHVDDAGLFVLDADADNGAIEVAHTTVSDCRDNGMLIWRSQKGLDGSRVVNCMVRQIGNKSGGSGQYGNGINAFRADGVLIAQSRITHCAYSAVRGNAASNIQVLGNQASDIGEVALYAEFGFEGAVIANNLVVRAATGIAVTNFDHGGRLAVVQGNLIRDLFRREHALVDKRGEGIAVEADAAVTGNVIEGAPSAGILIGWGPHMRDVTATGNIVRQARVGIAVSAAEGAGKCLVAHNLISGSRDGAIIAMNHGQAVSGEIVGRTSYQHVTLDRNVVS